VRAEGGGVMNPTYEAVGLRLRAWGRGGGGNVSAGVFSRMNIFPF